MLDLVKQQGKSILQICDDLSKWIKVAITISESVGLREVVRPSKLSQVKKDRGFRLCHSCAKLKASSKGFGCTKPPESFTVPQLSPAGNQFIEDLAQRHGVSTDAATHMLIAVSNGNGTMAQFCHSEFGGSGQWMQGGMTMVSDLFNHHLKNRVNNICSEIANALANHQLTPFAGSFQSQSQQGNHSQNQSTGRMGSQNSLFEPDPEAQWWPADLGTPNATGAQNNLRYAYFGSSRRLAVKSGTDIWVYDTLEHAIGGFSQQQSGGSTISFSSQFGTVDVSTLPVVSRNGIAQSSQSNPPAFRPEPSSEQPSGNWGTSPAPHASVNAVSPQNPATVSTPQSSAGEGILDTLERLGGLLGKGIITEDEFARKKAELLSRL